MLTIVVMSLLVALLAVEWWRGWRSVRVATVAFTLLVLAFAQPGPYRALRRAISLPPAERDTTFGPGGRRLSEYESGTMTMFRVVVEDAKIGANARAAAVGVLVWLSISPMLREAWIRRMERAHAGRATAPHASQMDGLPPAV